MSGKGQPKRVCCRFLDQALPLMRGMSMQKVHDVPCLRLAFWLVRVGTWATVNGVRKARLWKKLLGFENLVFVDEDFRDLADRSADRTI